MKAAPFVALVALAACGTRDQPRLKTEERPARVIDPPPQGVRALPPHAIRGDGVGPYRLGVPLEQLGSQVPSGARNAQLDIENVVHLSVLHAEDDAILIGTADPIGRANFVSIVRGDIARTESGIHVGSTRDDLARALGAPAVELDRARDPHVVVPSKMRELRAVLDNADHVIGIVIAAAEPATPTATGECVRPTIEGDDGLRTPHVRFGACLTGAGEIVTVDGDDLVIRAADGSARTIAAPPIPNIVFAAPLRNPDGRDELAVVARMEDVQARTWFLFAYRFDGTRLVKAVEPALIYRVTAANARWIGSALHDVDLDIEVTGRPDVYEVGGLLTTHTGDKLRDLVVLTPVQVPRRRAKSGIPEASDAGIADAAAEPADARTHP